MTKESPSEPYYEEALHLLDALESARTFIRNNLELRPPTCRTNQRTLSFVLDAAARNLSSLSKAFHDLRCALHKDISREDSYND